MSRNVLRSVLGLLAVVVLSVWLVAGCGDDDNGSDADAAAEADEETAGAGEEGADSDDAPSGAEDATQADDADGGEDATDGADASVTMSSTTTTTTTSEPPATTLRSARAWRPVSTRPPRRPAPVATLSTATTLSPAATTTSTSTTTTTTEPPLRPLWTATLSVAQGQYAGVGTGLGYSELGEGGLAPPDFEYEPGKSGRIKSLLLHPDGSDRLFVAESAIPSGLEGLWLKVADHLAVELGVPQVSQVFGDSFWYLDIPEGSLAWSAGDSVEVSLWAERPPLAPAPPRKLWTATLTPDADDYGGDLGRGVGFGASVSGNLDPQSYEYEPGAAAEFRRFLLLHDDDDRLYVAVNRGAGSGLEGLWLKVADHLAVEIGAAESLGLVDRWLFDLAEGTLDWTSGTPVEVSLWDKRPPLSDPPPRKLWTSTLSVAEADYGSPLGTGIGYGSGVGGGLSPTDYSDGPGVSGTITNLLVLPDDSDWLYVSDSGDPSGLEVDGLWLKVADHLAVQFRAPTGTNAAGDKEWYFTIPEGSLTWSDGDTVEVSLWDKRPPLAPAPPRQLWSTTMTVGFEPYQNEGPGYGYANGGHGSLSDTTYEYEPGSTAEILRIVLFTDGNDLVQFDGTNLRELAGLWLRLSDDLAIELTTLAENAEEEYAWTITDGSLTWAADDEIVISLWDKDPTAG